MTVNSLSFLPYKRVSNDSGNLKLLSFYVTSQKKTHTGRYVFNSGNLKLWYFMKILLLVSPELKDLLTAAAQESEASRNGYIIAALEGHLKRAGYRLPSRRTQKRRAYRRPPDSLPTREPSAGG